MNGASRRDGEILVGLGGLEPPTSPLSGVRSNHLSYRPNSAALAIANASGLLTRTATYCCFVKNKQKRTAFLSLQSRDQTICCGHLQLACRASIKEVIQPQVPLRLPCYDFTPVIGHTVVTAPLAVRLATSGATDSHGVTGGVYKARERIHRSMLICDY